MKTNKRSIIIISMLILVAIAGLGLTISAMLPSEVPAMGDKAAQEATREVAQYSTRTETVSQTREATSFRAWCDIDYKDGGHTTRYLGTYTIYADLGARYGFNVSNCDNTTVR